MRFFSVILEEVSWRLVLTYNHWTEFLQVLPLHGHYAAPAKLIAYISLRHQM
jgi:hypothetical protein